MRLPCLSVLGLGAWLCSAGSLELYDRLELAKTATATEIRRAYHQKARHAHPDKVDGDQAAKEAAAEKFKRLAEGGERERIQFPQEATQPFLKLGVLVRIDRRAGPVATLSGSSDNRVVSRCVRDAFVGSGWQFFR